MNDNGLTYTHGESERHWLATANSELRSENLKLSQELERLRAEVERLRAAGDALAEAVVRVRFDFAKALPRTATTRLNDALAAWQERGPS